MLSETQAEVVAAWAEIAALVARGDGIDIERASATWSTSSFTSYHGQLLSLAVQFGVAAEIERAELSMRARLAQEAASAPAKQYSAAEEPQPDSMAGRPEEGGILIAPPRLSKRPLETKSTFSSPGKREPRRVWASVRTRSDRTRYRAASRSRSCSPSTTKRER